MPVFISLCIKDKSFAFSAACLVPDSSSWECGEHPVIPNQEDKVIFKCIVIGIAGTCGQMHFIREFLMWAKDH